MSKSKKLEMWAGRADFIKAVKALGEVRIRDINELKEVLNRIGIVEPSYTWDDWNRAIAISSKCLHNQEKSRVKGRVYAQPPSTREQLALFILYGRYDAITGQELPVKLRSLDA